MDLGDSLGVGELGKVERREVKVKMYCMRVEEEKNPKRRIGKKEHYVIYIGCDGSFAIFIKDLGYKSKLSITTSHNESTIAQRTLTK